MDNLTPKQQLEIMLKEDGLTQLYTTGDGNCLFWALKRMLPLDEDVQLIRENVALEAFRLAKQNVTIVERSRVGNDEVTASLSDWITDEDAYDDWENYYQIMRQSEVYADDPCLWAAVSLYNRKITLYVSNGTIRIFDKHPSWKKGTTNGSIIIGNWHRLHYVATAPSGSKGSGGSGSEGSEESEESDESDDNLEYLLEENEFLTLKQMYAETFDVEMGDVSELDCNLDKFINGCGRYADAEPGFEEERTEYIMENIGFLEDIADAEFDYESERSHGIQAAIISLDYCHSVLNWEEYKNDFLRDRDEEETKTLYNRLVNNYFKGSCEKVINGRKKQSLKKCIAMAIKIGLNYQELEKFKVAHIQQVLMDESDARELGITLTPITLKQIRKHFGDEVVPRGTLWAGDKPFKEYKVYRSDLESSPYWEGIPVEYDLGDAVSLSKLTMTVPNVYINRTKRETLLKIYDTFGDYNVNLDTATPDQLKKLCDLKTPRLAPRVFERGDNNMEKLYDEWMQSDRSVKLFRGDLAKPLFFQAPYISATEIPRAGDTSVSDIISGDFTNIGTLISTGNPVSNAAIVADPVVPTFDPVDANFARQLSDAFVELGFLPRGSEEYCGVKALNKRQRGASKEESDKRQRTELFTAIEIH